MPEVDFATLTSPVSDADPCGPDLDQQGDPEFMNYMARAEGLLPATYFSGPDGGVFDRASIDVEAEFTGAKPFLDQTRDLRLLILLAKFSALNRDIGNVVTVVSAIAELLDTQWDAVHPRAEDGDYGIRIASLETLDDTAPVVMPLQYMPLLQGKRSGPISYRTFMFLSGDAQPRESEEMPDRAIVDRAISEVELSTLIERRDQFASLQAALKRIGDLCRERASGGTVSLEKVPALTGKILSTLNDIIVKRDPSAAPAAASTDTSDADGPEQTPSNKPGGPAAGIRTSADVASSLAAIDRYFSRSEPSNPALLLVRQAQQLMGKSFLEAMQILVPGHIGQAKFQIGKDQLFEIPIESLSSFATVETTTDDAGDATGAADGNGAAENPAPAPIVATSRREAFILLEQIGSYYRVAEPSSPIALLTDRARSCADRDFLSLLKELIPPPPSY